MPLSQFEESYHGKFNHVHGQHAASGWFSTRAGNLVLRRYPASRWRHIGYQNSLAANEATRQFGVIFAHRITDKVPGKEGPISTPQNAMR